MSTQRSISNRLRLRAFRRLSRLFVMTGRLLLCLTGFLLIVMPWTEHYSSLDRFLRGGQDVELGLFALLSFLCLVLVLSQHFRQKVAMSLAQWQSLPLAFQDCFKAIQAMTTPGLHTGPECGPPSGIYNSPLQV